MRSRYDTGMRRLVLIVACVGLALAGLSLGAVNARAETVYLKGGSKLSGKIIEQDANAIKLEVNVEGGGSAVITIKRSRIDRIEAADSFADRISAAQRRLEGNFFAEAERDFRELVRENSRHAPARMGLARALYAQNKLAEALKTLDHYMILVPVAREPRLLLLAAEYRMYSGDYSEAKSLAREAAALDPTNSEIADAAKSLSRRVERYRDGTEAAEIKAAEQRAEIERLASSRAEYDRTVGNNFDACEAAAALLVWLRETDQNLSVAIKVSLDADARAETAFARGQDVLEYRRAVSIVTCTLVVAESEWLRFFDHVKQQHIYGFYYQLKARYPRTAPIVSIVKREPDDRGRTRQVDLARGSWDGKRARVVVDLWTPLNPDRTRAAGIKNGKR